MNDEELIERLRGTFRGRADGLRPAPAVLPSAEAGRPEQTAPYPVMPPTGPVPVTRRRSRRWPPVVGVGALMAAAAATSVAVALSSGSHPVTVPPVDRGTVSTPPSAAQTTPPTAGPTVPPASTPIGATTQPVVAGFQPESVTFISAEDGWAAGTAAGRCAVMAHTTDGGRTWSNSGVPQMKAACGPGDAGTRFEVRFADSRNGWLYSSVGPSSLQGVLWSTHDGGATWKEQVPLEGGTIGALEASTGEAQMVVYGPCPTGRAGCHGETVEQLLSAPVGSDSWQRAGWNPLIGAGPVLSPALTMWGSTAWLVNVNRTVVSGASLSPTGWRGWTPPCTAAGGGGLLAASSASDLVAVCAEGLWGAPDKGTTAGHNWLFRSTDGGKSFTPVGPAPGNQPISLTTPPGTTATAVLADGIDGLQATFDAGATWSTLEPGEGTGGASAGGYEFDYVGFTTSTQGVAVVRLPAPAVFMTRDGGHTWHPVDFAAST